MRKFPATPFEMLASLGRHWHLVVQLTQREVLGRYRGSMLGWAWSLFNPLFMLAIYTLVFSGVFNTRWPGGGDSGKADFALILFVGLIVHGVFAECINRAPALIVNNTNYVKKVVFPLEIIPWVALGSALFHAVISLVVLMGAQVVLARPIPATALLLPLVLLPLVFGVMGLAWLLASLGVYLRDISQLTAMFATVMQFISAVFFPLSALPEPYRSWLRLNPLAVVIEQSRDVLLFGRAPDLQVWSLTLAVGMGLAWAGFAGFQKARRGFANVL
ncbi:ABC transporter permease [Ramlibacter monticola]|uniref:Transport permease protein n=1 Tax=Ramlibacter monticola TaxID=1926872 RepID=A0A936Z734_9BURK|nr:ABC transporter permease [Ramlibacter monticola]MBL0394709.1 ABC transporter permease [Ramlibacter monticola]